MLKVPRNVSRLYLLMEVVLNVCHMKCSVSSFRVHAHPQMLVEVLNRPEEGPVVSDLQCSSKFPDTIPLCWS